MNELCLYVILGLLKVGRIEPCEILIAGEDAWRIVVELDKCYVVSFTFLRSEIVLLHEAYLLTDDVFTNDERGRFNDLFNVL